MCVGLRVSEVSCFVLYIYSIFINARACVCVWCVCVCVLSLVCGHLGKRGSHVSTQKTAGLQAAGQETEIGGERLSEGG